MPFRHCSKNGREANRVRSNPLKNGDCEHVHANLRFVMERKAIAARARLDEAFTEKTGLSRLRRRDTVESLARQPTDQAAFVIAHQDVQVEKAADFTGSRRLQGQR